MSAPMPSSQQHTLETSDIDGEVRGACTCGWHYSGWLMSRSAVREAHERHITQAARALQRELNQGGAL